MATAADHLRAIEARAERAIIQELRLMMQEILGLRTQLVLHDRAHADVLLMKLDRLERDQTAVPVGDVTSAFLAPMLSITAYETPTPSAYRVYFYDRQYGDLDDVATVPTFESAVQLVQDRLPAMPEPRVEASWTRHQGELSVRTPHGTVVARIEADWTPLPTAQAEVHAACLALRSGDGRAIGDLLCRLLQAA
nr:hypothetical protein [uncultured Roseateles sp.]